MDEMEKKDDMLVPLPEGIEKNLVKAAWKLSAGLLNIPLQAIERHLTEKKSQSDARIVVNQTLAQRISEQIDVPEEYVTLAVAKSFGNIVQEQLNLDSILEKTQQHLQNTPQDDPHTDSNIGEISDDWLNRFRESACQKSSEEAQELFSKVLAGEIRKPGSFSLKALTTLADMDQNVALYFKVFCSMCLVNLNDPKIYHITQSKNHFKIKDARIPILSGSTNELLITSTASDKSSEGTKKSLSKASDVSKSIYNIFGLSFSSLQLLSEYGLIAESFHSNHIEYSHFWYNNEIWGFLPLNTNMPHSSNDFQNILISGYALTSVGKELFHITTRNAHPQYWELLTDYLRQLYSVNLYKYPKPKKKSPPDDSANPHPTTS